jgi:acyl-coenzyme A thioesterase 9
VDDLWTFRQQKLDEDSTRRSVMLSSHPHSGVGGRTGVKLGFPPAADPHREYQVRDITPRETEVRYSYNFSTDERLCDAYSNPWGYMRMGRLIEDLDALAGTIAFRFCHNPADMDLPPLMIVTASADRVEVEHRANLESNMELSGQVTWAGRSSMEIAMTIRSNWSDEPWISSRFTFVARDVRTGKAAPINRLVPRTDPERAIFDVGLKRDAKRKEQRKHVQQSFGSVKSGLLTWKSEQDIALARDLMAQGQNLGALPHVADRDGCLMSSTMLSNAFLCQKQQRNIHGRVFGGFLMRRASELAFANCYQFSGQQPRFRSIGAVQFLQPVDIGDMLKFDSWILFTKRLEKHDTEETKCFAVSVEVYAYKTDPVARSVILSNKFNFLFHVHAQKDGLDVKNVYPGAVEDAHMIVEGIREHESREAD